MSKARTYPVYAIVGNDRFLRHDELAAVLTILAGAGEPVAPTRMEGASAVLADVLDDVRTPPLIGGPRVVLIDDADDFISKHRPALEKYCAAPSTAGTLVFLCDSMPKNTRLYKIIGEYGRIIACEPPKGRAVVSWIVARAISHYDKKISQGAAQLLRDQIGDAVGTLDTELAKLATFVGSRAEIAAEDVKTLTTNHREEKVFAVTDAIASGDTAGALRAWEQVLATDRAAEGRAIGGLAWGVRRLLGARRDLDNGVGLMELSRRLFTDPKVLEARLQRADASALVAQQRDLLDADVAVKTGASSVSIAIEKFIVKHCTRRQRPATSARGRA